MRMGRGLQSEWKAFANTHRMHEILSEVQLMHTVTSKSLQMQNTVQTKPMPILVKMKKTDNFDLTTYDHSVIYVYLTLSLPCCSYRSTRVTQQNIVVCHMPYFLIIIRNKPMHSQNLRVKISLLFTVISIPRRSVSPEFFMAGRVDDEMYCPQIHDRHHLFT